VAEYFLSYVRFPRIVRIRNDKTAADIDTLETVEKLYNHHPTRRRVPKRYAPQAWHFALKYLSRPNSTPKQFWIGYSRNREENPVPNGSLYSTTLLHPLLNSLNAVRLLRRIPVSVLKCVNCFMGENHTSTAFCSL
jgi:hypothetical protein